MTSSNSLVEVLRLLELMGSFDSSEEKRGNVAQLKAAIGQLHIQQEYLRTEIRQQMGADDEPGVEQMKVVLAQVRERLDKLKEYLKSAETSHTRQLPTSSSLAQRVGKDGGYKPLPFKEAVVPPPISSFSHQTMREQGPPEIAEHEIIFDENRDFIGKGSYGYVYRGICRGKRVAIKVPKQQLPPRKLEQFRQEVHIMSRIFHPNIVLFMGACTRGDRIKIVTELCVTDLEKLLRSNTEITMPDRMQMAKGAALGMNWLHGILNIIHRDLKSANLLISDDGTVKVTDFGFGKLFEAGTTFKGRAKGTPLWMAPEVMLGKETNEKRDVYSFGIILWEMITREEPFQQFKDWNTFKRAVAIDGVRPDIPEKTQPALKFLIERCWDADYKQRPTFAEIIFRLNEVIVDYMVEDKYGRAFWKAHFLQDQPDLVETVDWEEFLSILKLELDWSEGKKYGHSDSALNLLKSDLCHKEVGLKKATPMKDEVAEVTLSNFSHVIDWHGPFFMRQHIKTILDTLTELKNSPWYHGFISKDEATLRLETRDPNTFLVRLSTTSPGKPFTLSVIMSNTDIAHRRISHYFYGDSFTIRIHNVDYNYDSLVELVRACKPLLKLGEPCPPTPGRTSNYL